nr:hypothetical protein [Tanacetum cinerariifolium]
MSDVEDSTVTYTKVSSLFGDLSDIGSLRVGGMLMMPKDPYAYVEAAFQAPPSPNYMPGPEEPEQAPPPPEFVPKPVYPKFIPPEGDVVPVEEQPLPAAILLIADSPRYITESNLDEYPEKDDEDPDEDPADYPIDREDVDEGEEFFVDDVDDEEEDKDEDEEEEENPAPVDAVPPPPGHRTTARISIPVQAPVPFLSEAEFERLIALPTPPPSPLTPYSSPLPQIPSLPLPSSPAYPLAPRSKTPPLGTPPLLHISLPTSSLPLLLPSIDCREDVYEVTLSPHKRLCIALGLRFKVGESSSARTARPTGGFRADYGFVGTLDAEIRHDLDMEIDDDRFCHSVRQDTDEIYGRLDDAQDDRLLMSSQLNMLHTDRRSHARTARLMKSKARLSREAWVQFMDTSDTTHAEVMSLCTTVLAQQTEIA